MGVMVHTAHASDNATESAAMVVPATPSETEGYTDIIPPSNGVIEQPAEQEEPAVNEEEEKNEEQPNKSEEGMENAEEQSEQPEQPEQPEQSEQSEQSEQPELEQTDLEVIKPETTENPEEAIGFSITGVTIKNNNGVVIGEGSDDQLDLNDAVEISYNWSLADDHTFQVGSTYEFDIPKHQLIGELSYRSEDQTFTPYYQGASQQKTEVFAGRLALAKNWESFNLVYGVDAQDTV